MCRAREVPGFTTAAAPAGRVGHDTTGSSGWSAGARQEPEQERARPEGRQEEREVIGGNPFGPIGDSIPRPDRPIIPGRGAAVPAARAEVPMTRTMRFSWPALLLAPLPVPVLLSAAFVFLTPGRNQLWGFLFFAAVGAVFSYGGTVVLLLPCLFLLSRVTRLNALWAGALGALLGLAIYLPKEWISWHASGVDSGPPSDTFAQYLARNFFSLELPCFVGAGLVAALLYWWLAGLRPRRDRSPAA